MRIETRFWAKVRKAGTEECWVWGAYRNARGYGKFGIGSVVYLAHRVSWRLANGPVPDGLCVCHHCDNPPCVNPAHLFLGSQSDNLQDMFRKSRARRALGERAPKAKLTESGVVRIRELRAGGRTLREIARLYGITEGTVRAAVTGRTWRHIQ